MQILEQIFQIVYDWDMTWAFYKTGNFWEVKASEMEVTVQRIFKQLIASMKIKLLKDQSWKMIETTRDSIDAFRRVLPLLSDLKNKAMRTRHWNEVRDIMNECVQNMNVQLYF